MSTTPLPDKPTETEAEQDARLVARLASRYPFAAKVLTVLMVVSVMMLGAMFGMDALRGGVKLGLKALGVPLAEAPVVDGHDAGVGPAVAEARLRQAVGAAVGEQLAAFRESERAWSVQQMAATEARLNLRIDQAILLARGRSALAVNVPTPWAPGTTHTAATTAN